LRRGVASHFPPVPLRNIDRRSGLVTRQYPISGQIEKFIDIDEEVTPLFKRDVRARVRGKTKDRHEKATSERRAVVADPALSQVRDQYLALIHRLTEAQLPPGILQGNMTCAFGRRNCSLGGFSYCACQNRPYIALLRNR